MPLLSEVIEWANTTGMRVNIELKRDLRPSGSQLGERRRLVRATAAVLAAARAPIVVSSFDPFMLLYAARVLPEVPRCFIFQPSMQRYLPWDTGAALGFDGFHPEQTMVSRYATDFAHARGAVVNVWTVNDRDGDAALAKQGVDGIITDRVDWF